MAKVDPPLALKLTISGAHRVVMKAKPTRQFSRAGQSLPRRQVVAEDAEDDLRDELFADGDFAAAGKPELHAATILSGEESVGQPEDYFGFFFFFMYSSTSATVLRWSSALESTVSRASVSRNSYRLASVASAFAEFLIARSLD